MTTRLQALGSSAQPISVTPLTQEEGTRFLLQRARLASTDNSKAVSASELDVASEIVAAMDGLPLALDQAGAYIEETQCSLADYLQQYRYQRAALLARRGKSSLEHPASVQATFLLSLQQVALRYATASNLLFMTALLAPDAIPEELLMVGFLADDDNASEEVDRRGKLDEMIATVGTYSLVQRNTTTKTVSIHRLIQAVLLDNLSNQERVQLLISVISALNRVFPETVYGDYIKWNQCQRLLPHVLQCAKYAESWQHTSSELATLLYTTGTYLKEQAHYQEAEHLLQKALHMREQLLGHDHYDVAVILKILSLLYHEQGRYAEAETSLKRTLHIWDQTQGSGTKQFIFALNNLGNLYRELGRYAEAEPLLVQAIEKWQELADGGLNQLAAMLNNLGQLCYELRRYSEAELYLTRAMHYREQELGREHPLLAFSLTNLGRIYADRGLYTKAEEILLHAVHMREQTLGPAHPLVAYPLTNLGHLYQLQEKYSEGEVLLLRAVEILKLAVGEESPQVTFPLMNLGNLYCNQGQYTEAEGQFKRVKHIMEQTQGSQHFWVAESLFALAKLSLYQHDLCTSQEYYQQASAIWQNAPGLDHPLVIAWREEYTQLKEKMEGTKVSLDNL